MPDTTRTVRSVLLGTLGVVVLLFVAGSVIGTRGMLFEMAHDPAGLESERWPAADFVRLRVEAGTPWNVPARAEEGRPERPRERPSRAMLLMTSAGTMVTAALITGLVIGVPVFLFAPLFRRKGSRWRSPRVNRFRWALIGSACAAAAFAVPEARHMARLSLHVQSAGILSPPPATPDSYWMTYWWMLSRELVPLCIIAVTGVLVVLVGLWAANRWRSKTGGVSRVLDAAPGSHDGLRWVFIGALWMASAAVFHEAYLRWIMYPLMANYRPIPGADGVLPVPDVTWQLAAALLLVTLLGKLTIVAAGTGVIAAGWRVTSRRRPDAAKPTA